MIADEDNDGLVDGDEAIHGTNPKDSNTDKDIYPDSREISLGTNPLIKDKLVEMSVRSFYVDQLDGCEGLVYDPGAGGPQHGGGEFDDTIYWQGEIGTYVLDAFNTKNPVRYHETGALGNGLIRFVLRENGPSYRLYSNDIREIDSNGINYTLGKIKEQTGTFDSVTIKGTENKTTTVGERTRCMLTIAYTVKWVQ